MSNFNLNTSRFNPIHPHDRMNYERKKYDAQNE